MDNLNMGGISFQSNSKRIGLHSCFCPTPLTLLTGGADARAWEARCNTAQGAIFDWSNRHGIKLKRESMEEERAADEQPATRPVPKSESGEKPQPETKGRFR